MFYFFQIYNASVEVHMSHNKYLDHELLCHTFKFPIKKKKKKDPDLLWLMLVTLFII